MQQPGELITITANNRLARRLLAESNALAERAGAAAWERASILPWGAWIRRLYHELLLAGHETRALLSGLAEMLLWEEIAAKSVGDDAALPLIDIPGAARSIQAAWALLREYELPLEVLVEHDMLETRMLKCCCAAFTRRCREAALCDEAWLTGHISAAFEQGKLEPPAGAVFYGFDELSPARQRLIRMLESKGVPVEHRGAARYDEARPQRVMLRDGDLEIRAAVRWATSRLTSAPKERIAIVTPQLADQRARLLQELVETLEPQSLLPGQRPHHTLFNFSLGEALSAAPLAHDALLWWRLAAGHALSLDQLLVLLRSPFCADAESEADSRALFGLELRRRGRPKMDLDAFAELAQRHQARREDAPARWTETLAGFAMQARGLAEKVQPAAEWRGALRELLKRVGWPGERPVDSDEYQQMKRLGEELDSLTSLDLIRPEGFDLRGILLCLERSLDAAIFQPESQKDAPLQVLGQLEATGQRFDRVWLLGLDEAHWPARAEPNAFLPLALQREHAMPHATPQLSLERAQRITRELLASAKEVIVSTPQREGEVECMPSPLIAHLPLISCEALTVDLAGRLAQDFAAGDLEYFEDQRGPKLEAPAQLGGGSSIFADQAACPFRAFARRRLGADPLKRPEEGLDAITIGKLVHRALDLIWKVLESHAGLVATSKEERARQVSRSVDIAIEESRAGLAEVFQPRLTALLRARLEKLLSIWLEIEAERAPFRVLTREERKRLVVGGISCDVQVDRIDELSDGAQVILDYKTGKSASSSGWLQERIGEPQLPLYTLSTKSTVGGVALAKVRRDKAGGFEGIWAEDDTFPPEFSKKKVKLRDSKEEALSLEERLARWKEQLEGLAHELLSGWAAVSPAKDACTYCGLDTLCRHLESDATPDDDDDDEVEVA